uniref:Uncharacterized protein n=1 Tax=Anguilla anguilla TaxID=7936 RepID=A0A0E9WCX5_ANGAN
MKCSILYFCSCKNIFSYTSFTSDVYFI